MEFFKAQLSRIQEQLNGLSATQKMLTASLVAIMIMTLMWWSRYAGDPEMEPVLDQSLSQSDIGLITANLDGKGIAHKVVGDRVLVASDQKTEVLAELGYAQALPKNFSNAFDELIKQSNPFTSPEQNDRLFMRAKEAELEAILCNLPDVANASVVIDPTSEQRFDAASIQPSASVTITTQRASGGEGKQIANSAAQIVSGAQAGLLRSRINVIVDGAPFRIEDPDDNGLMDGSDIVENQQQQEHFYESKVRDEFSFIRGLMVSVTVQVNSSATEIKSRIVSSDPKQMVHVEAKTEEQTTDETGAASSSTEAGVAANTGVSAAGPASGGSTSNTDDQKTEFYTDPSAEEKDVKQGPGEATVLGASVRVPRSYLADEYRVKNGKDADEATLEQFSIAELSQIAKDVMACTGLKTQDSVVVSSYVDAQPTEATSVQSSPMAAPMTMLNNHTKDIGVGALAMMSMFMMFVMVKKSTPALPSPVVVESNEPRSLDASTAVAGQVTEGNAMLDGMELDEDSVKAQQMLDQVQQMVTSNPDSAATLVKRWLNK